MGESPVINCFVRHLKEFDLFPRDSEMLLKGLGKRDLTRDWIKNFLLSVCSLTSSADPV